MTSGSSSTACSRAGQFPRGPSLDPEDKRLAVEVEDHPIEYASFEGTIPQGQYGGGTVMVWDRGTWEPKDGTEPRAALKRGKLEFELNGDKLIGAAWVLESARHWGSVRAQAAVASP